MRDRPRRLGWASSAVWLALSACELYDAELAAVREVRSGATAAGGGTASPDLAATGCVPNPEGDALCPQICPEQCNDRDDDCDGRSDEAADETCAAEAANTVCVAGRCTITHCRDDARDCDSLAENGCEVPVDAPAHCGACGRRCLLEHAQASCHGGECGVLACDPGFASCDGRDANGCETSLRTATDCGRCGLRCGAAETCREGRCVPDRQPDAGPPPMCTPDESGCSCTPGAAAGSCSDACPDDPDKRAPGECGCGVPDLDSDADGAPDCRDACPQGAWSTAPCLPYEPANIDARALDFAGAPSAALSCGTTVLDTTQATPVLRNWCGRAPSLSVQQQADGTSIVVVPLQALSVSAGSSLRLVGTRPVAIVVRGDVVIEGSLDASSTATEPGAGADQACGASAGADGSGSTSSGAGGGGGGGYGTVGGAGGSGDGARPGVGGVVRGSAQLVPLLGGCTGGRGGGSFTAAVAGPAPQAPRLPTSACSSHAAGGGALQLSAAGHIKVSGAIRANGASGARGCGNEGGGGGGGSGGALLLEASSVDAAPGALQVLGGAGGAAEANGGRGAAASTLAGGPGQSHGSNGGGGGGGGFGRIRIQLH